MGRKCVTGCRSNYDLTDKISVFRLPKDKDERECWMKAIPRDNIPDSAYTVVCIKHFPDGFETVSVKGRLRPKNPPSIFPNLPKSLVPTPVPLARTTFRSSSSVRSVESDQLEEYLQKDIVSFDSLCSRVGDHSFDFPFDISAFRNDNSLCLQSMDYLPSSSIPRFLLKISPDQSFEGFHAGVKTSIKSLCTNKIVKLNRWSQLKEALRYLNSLELDQKKSVLLEQCVSLGTTKVGTLKYSSEIIVRAFEYLATSRTLYNRLRKDFGLPGLATLNRLSSKVNNSSDYTFISNVFTGLDQRQKQFILLLDEVYVKPLLTYHGGMLFGKAVNNPEHLATTVLGFMLVSPFGGPSFLVKMLPVWRLDANFMFEQTQLLLAHIKNAGGSTICIICDNNRVNQAFFKMFPLISPWKTNDNMFLLYDFIHILKNIRNNWLTEKTGEIIYNHNGDQLTAKWQQIQLLQKCEDQELIKMSKVTFQAANPKPIERQRVETCLRVFCNETKEALINHPGMQKENVDGTVNFLEKIITFFKIMNVKSPNEDVRQRDPLRTAIVSPDDSQLHFLTEFANFAASLKGSHGKREKKLTADTATAIQHTCLGVVEMAKYLLQTNRYVLLGKFTTDPLENSFGKLRQGSGGTYFINAQQILEKVNLMKTKVLLRLNLDVSGLNSGCGHTCEKCVFHWTHELCELIESLPEMENSVKTEVKCSLVYIAGYVMRKDTNRKEDSFRYFEKYGGFTSSLSRGGLVQAGDCASQWTIFCYIAFQSVSDKVCRNSLSEIFMDISQYYGFEMRQHNCFVMSNILLNNFCKISNLPSEKEPKQKVLKLSS